MNEDSGGRVVNHLRHRERSGEALEHSDRDHARGLVLAGRGAGAAGAHFVDSIAASDVKCMRQNEWNIIAMQPK
jgi:L-asparaginase/Glu-tRNA(Gln) amidotransferase subunit D